MVSTEAAFGFILGALRLNDPRGVLGAPQVLGNVVLTPAKALEPVFIEFVAQCTLALSWQSK
jgi:hypothetical protein